MFKYFFCFFCFGLMIFYGCNDTTTSKEKKVKVIVEEGDSLAKNYSSGVINLSHTTDVYEALCQTWIDIDDEQTLREIDENTSLGLAVRSFSFFDDGSCVKNYRSAWQYGKWNLDNATKTITINYKNEKVVYKISAIASDELNLINKSVNTSTILQFLGTEKRMKKIEEEPFHINNNQWRMPPAKAETDAEIKQRLLANLKFFEIFYKSSLAKNDRTISFYGLPSCLRWYGGGIYLQKKEELNEQWIECFYNKNQALKAYNIMENLLSKKYIWPKENIGWVKKNLAVLQQMIKNLEAETKAIN